MKVIIIGLGKVGRYIVKELAKEGHDIVVVDNNRELVEDISTTYDVLGVIGDTVSQDVLKDAQVEDANLFIAVTNTDEINMMACLFAKKINEDIKTIARVRNPLYSEQGQYIKKELGITSLINPEIVTAREISRMLKISSAVQIESFSRGRIDLITFKVPNNSLLINKSIKDISKTITNEALFVGISRKDDVIVPHGNTVIQEGDTVSVILRTDKITGFFKKIKQETLNVNNIMIIGGGRISYYLASLLEKSDIKVTIIEKDKKRCEELNSKLNKANIILGDATDDNILDEEGLAEANGFVALSNIDEENVMLSLYAKTKCNGKIISKIDHINYDNVLNSLELDSIISPKKIIASEIVGFVRALDNAQGNEVSAMYRIMNDKAEVITFNIKNTNSFIGVPIRDLVIDDNALICSIIRKDNIIAPSGDDTIEIGDIVLVTTTKLGINDIEEIFK